MTTQDEHNKTRVAKRPAPAGKGEPGAAHETETAEPYAEAATGAGMHGRMATAESVPAESELEAFVEAERTELIRSQALTGKHIVVADGDEQCLVELEVIAFAYPDCDGHGAFDPGRDTPQSSLALTLQREGLAWSDCGTTGPEGVVRWSLSPGNYRVIAPMVPGYEMPAKYYVSQHKGSWQEHPLTDLIAVGETPVRVTVGYQPKQALLQLTAYLFQGNNGTGRIRIAKAGVDLYQQGEHIGCIETGENGTGEYGICRPGLVTLEPRPLKIKARTVRALLTGPLVVQVQAGQVCPVEIDYGASLATLHLGVCFVQAIHGKEERIPLPNCRFEISRGTEIGSPIIRTAITGATGITALSDLDEGQITVRLISWPKVYRGVMIEPDRTRGTVVHPNLTAGQPFKLHDWFCLRPCTGHVRGFIVDAECGDGLAGVNLIFGAADGKERAQIVTSGPNGEIVAENLRPGKWVIRLEQDKITTPDGRSWEPTVSTPIEQVIEVLSGAVTPLPQILLAEEEHAVHGLAPHPHAVIEIWDEQKQLVATAIADANRRYRQRLPREGRYLLTIGKDEMVADVHSDFEANWPESPKNGSAGNNAGVAQRETRETVESFEDLSAYPILTEDVSFPSGGRSGSSGTAGTSSLQATVDNTLAQVLGRKLKTDDPGALLASLTRSFNIQQVEGRSEVSWVPRSYAVQSELGGGVTGAQASIYHRAKVALDDALPLLDGIYPLDPAFDQQEVDAVRSIVRTEFVELVNELGIESGPRVQRVDDLFNMLQKKLRDMEDVFGLVRTNIITVDEEQNYTNFLVVRDYVDGLGVAWQTFRPQFVGTDQDPKFLGTQLVLLSQALSVVAEGVDEANMLLDSVFIGPAERQTLRLTFPAVAGSTPPPMFVGELLDWVLRFSTEEARALIQDGGKRGVAAIHETATRLRELVGGAARARVAHRGFNSGRVRRSFVELALQIQEVENLAREILFKGDLLNLVP